MKVLLGTNQIAAAKEFAERFLETAIDKVDYVAAYAFGAEAIPVFCPAVDLELGSRIAGRLSPLFALPEVSRQLKHDARLIVSFWNEAGNVMRYAGRSHEALRYYGMSRSYLPFVDDEKKRAADTSVLDLNEGIVFRDLGRFSEALPKLLAAVGAAPRDAGRQINLAVQYLRTGQFEQAAAAADTAPSLLIARHRRWIVSGPCRCAPRPT